MSHLNGNSAEDGIGEKHRERTQRQPTTQNESFAQTVVRVLKDFLELLSGDFGELTEKGKELQQDIQLVLSRIDVDVENESSEEAKRRIINAMDMWFEKTEPDDDNHEDALNTAPGTQMTLSPGRKNSLSALENSCTEMEKTSKGSPTATDEAKKWKLKNAGIGKLIPDGYVHADFEDNVPLVRLEKCEVKDGLSVLDNLSEPSMDFLPSTEMEETSEGLPTIDHDDTASQAKQFIASFMKELRNYVSVDSDDLPPVRLEKCEVNDALTKSKKRSKTQKSEG